MEYSHTFDLSSCSLSTPLGLLLAITALMLVFLAFCVQMVELGRIFWNEKCADFLVLVFCLAGEGSKVKHFFPLQDSTLHPTSSFHIDIPFLSHSIPYPNQDILFWFFETTQWPLFCCGIFLLSTAVFLLLMMPNLVIAVPWYLWLLLGYWTWLAANRGWKSVEEYYLYLERWFWLEKLPFCDVSYETIIFVYFSRPFRPPNTKYMLIVPWIRLFVLHDNLFVLNSWHNSAWCKEKQRDQSRHFIVFVVQ